MPTLEISLSEPAHAFVKKQTTSGGFQDEADYMRSLIKSAYESQSRTDIDAKILEAIDQIENGDSSDMTSEDWNRLRREHGQRHNLP